MVISRAQEQDPGWKYRLGSYSLNTFLLSFYYRFGTDAGTGDNGD